MRYAAFTSCTQNYSDFLTIFLNSFNEKGHTFSVYVLCLDMDEGFLRELESREWNFELNLIRDNIDKGVRFYHKKSRYWFASQYSDIFDVILFLDVDMIFLRNITRFLDLVVGTQYIIGCNERFKWNMNRFTMAGETLPSKEMLWMVCNAPLFVPKTLKYFWGIVKEVNSKLKHKDEFPSDLYSMNVAIWKANLHKNIIPLPNYAWTGVHNGYFNIYTRIVCKNGNWLSLSGEPVYMIHGRWTKKNAEKFYLSEQEKRYNELQLPENVKEKQRKLDKRTVGLLRQEALRCLEL